MTMLDDAGLLHHPLQSAARRWPDKTALVCGKRRATFADVLHEAGVVAAALREHALQPGDRVALFLDNGIEAASALYAVWMVGAVAVPVHPLTKAAKLAQLIDDAGAALLLTQATLRPAWDGAITRCTSLRACFVTGMQPPGGDARVLPWPAAAGQAAKPAAATRPDDLAAIIYTSGTTGTPKGVMLTHHNMLSAARSVQAYLGLHEHDVILSALPLAFSYGLYQVLLGLAVGATVVLERNFSFPAKVLDTMAVERVTVFPGVPTMFAQWMGMKNLDRYDLDALRLVTSAAAPLPLAQIRWLRATFPQMRLYSMYGQTECKRISYLPPEQLDVRPDSVGRGMPNQACWLVDEQGRRLPNGSTGELVVQGPHVMQGYWRKPTETAQRLKACPAVNDTALYTGDIFRTDAEGYLYFVARRDDIIKSRGEKVSPREVEDALHAIEGVCEAAVIGVPDALLGEAVKAYVTLHPGVQLTERELIKHCLARLESYMVPKHVEIVDALPRTDNGKITKAGLRTAVSPTP
ncbi:acyl--CoA ligase [Schlegelella sp. S2-27]|uniref:Acyl--CoA ligase n=1 Tax=Caldimonas mangrovi TaxID=2944811 RepID=A0ABT0YRK8_9BURK|nr:class I adenylate-forming enzyme family protein [Caldimonas mangrovi]MCM5681382.1 acyl--CoA ligase [Caldimonas mangrovi]